MRGHANRCPEEKVEHDDRCSVFFEDVILLAASVVVVASLVSQVDAVCRPRIHLVLLKKDRKRANDKNLTVLGLLAGLGTLFLEPAVPIEGRFPATGPSSSNSLFLPRLPGRGIGVEDRGKPFPGV